MYCLSERCIMPTLPEAQPNIALVLAAATAGMLSRMLVREMGWGSRRPLPADREVRERVGTIVDRRAFRYFREPFSSGR